QFDGSLDDRILGYVDQPTRGRGRIVQGRQLVLVEADRGSQMLLDDVAMVAQRRLQVADNDAFGGELPQGPGPILGAVDLKEQASLVAAGVGDRLKRRRQALLVDGASLLVNRHLIEIESDKLRPIPDRKGHPL